jgi:hypothetical protein
MIPAPMIAMVHPSQLPGYGVAPHHIPAGVTVAFAAPPPSAPASMEMFCGGCGRPRVSNPHKCSLLKQTLLIIL